jgi:hypothetical protein
LQRQIVQQYGLWYNEAEIIIKSYLPDKIDEFRVLKNGNSLEYGITSTLQFSRGYENLPDKRDIIRDFNFKFDTQKNILIALANTIHLLPTKKDVSQNASANATPVRQGNTTIYAYRDININSQPLNIDINTQNFEQLRSIIQESSEEQEIKSNLLSQVDDLKNTQNTSNYVESFHKFMETAANSATVWTVIQPMIPFLMGLLQS